MNPRLAHHTSHLHGGKKKKNSFRVGLILKILLPVLLKLRKTGRNGGSGKNMVNIFLRCRSSKHSTEVRLSEEVLWYRVESEWVFCTESSENWRAGCSASAQLISVSELDLLWLSQCLVIGGSKGFDSPACRSVLGQVSEPQTAPDVLLSRLQGSHCRQCMYYCKSLWTKASAKCKSRGFIQLACQNFFVSSGVV